MTARPLADLQPAAGPTTAVSDQGELLDLILSATVEGMIDWKITANEIRYTPRWKLMLGYEPQELVEGPNLWRQLTHPDDLPRVEDALRDHLESQWPFDELCRMRHREGEWRWIHVRGFSSRDAEGDPVRLIIWFCDVNDQVKTEEQNRMLATALRAAGEGICALDVEGRITFANPAACAVLQRASSDLIGKSAHAIAHGDGAGDEAPHTEETCPVLAPLRDVIDGRVTADYFARPDGSRVPVGYVSAPIRNADQSSITGAVVAFQDMSLQRELEAQLLQAQKLEAIGQLAAGVAHEINTPMQFIGDNVSFLELAFGDLMTLLSGVEQAALQAAAEGQLPPALAGQFQHMQSEMEMQQLHESIPGAIRRTISGVETVSSIVKAMKAFSHPGWKDKSFEDVNAALQNTVTVTRHEWKNVAQIQFELAPDLPAVRCFPGELNQVFSNVIVNAAQAIDEARSKKGEDAPLGRIRIQTRLDGSDTAEIRISDDGPGIPKSIHNRVFDPFFTTKPVGKGSGQGLSIARAIVVKRHGGAIAFESEPGMGTTFIIRLPVNGS